MTFSTQRCVDNPAWRSSISRAKSTPQPRSPSRPHMTKRSASSPRRSCSTSRTLPTSTVPGSHSSSASWGGRGPAVAGCWPAASATITSKSSTSPGWPTFAPRWTRWLALAAVLASLSTVLSDGVGTFADVVILIFVLAMQVYRFRALSTWGQRQQTKWAIAGLAAAVVGFIGLLIMPTTNGSLVAALRDHGFVLAISAIPLSIGLSVLRNRLWDIDRIISRALLYFALTLSLAGIYIGGVIGLQALFRLAIGNGSAPAIALSTLAIVALFGPLRRRIQSLIDRRFYRGRYDAARTLSAFGERLRDQVELSHLSRDLTSVVHDTLHPEHVSLWLRETSNSVPARGRAEAS
jgi:hypothetical protein